MELTLDKTSFLDEFRTLKSIENRSAPARTDGFRYLHEMTTCRLADGEGFKIGDLDFTRFTYDDLLDYMTYYSDNLEPKINLANKLFGVPRSAGAIFAPDKRYY